MLWNFSAISLTYDTSGIWSNSHEDKTCWKCIRLFESSTFMLRPITSGYIAGFSRYCTSSFADITITFISIKFAVLWSDWFLRYFGKSNGAMSFSFFICLFKSKHNVQHNLFFAFKIKNCCYLCRFYHKRAFELIDWVIWLVNQFWLFRLNKHQLVKYY